MTSGSPSPTGRAPKSVPREHVENPGERARWQCSGCGFKTDDNVGACKGYCFDDTGNSCDARACPRCGKFHYWTGSVQKDFEPKRPRRDIAFPFPNKDEPRMP